MNPPESSVARRRRGAGSPLAAVVAFLAVAAPLFAAEPFTVIAERTLRPDGTLAPGLAVVVGSDGRIARIVSVDEANLPSPRRFPAGSVVTPGLHELFSRLGAPGENIDNTESVDDGARAAAAIDPRRADLDRARRGGVLVATVAPATVNAVAGRAVTFATGTRTSLDAMAEGPLMLTVGVSALDRLREPTSRAGLRNILAAWLAQQKKDTALCVTCDEAVDVRLALELFGGRRAPTFVLKTEAGRAARRLAPLSTVVVVGPYAESTTPVELAGAAVLSRAGVEIAFRGAMPAGDENSLRTSARLSVNAGLGAPAARRAMTSNPAQVAGVADRVGRLEAGRRADLVIFSGDPLHLGSTVLAIYQEGTEHSTRASGDVPTLEDPR